MSYFGRLSHLRFPFWLAAVISGPAKCVAWHVIGPCWLFKLWQNHETQTKLEVKRHTWDFAPNKTQFVPIPLRECKIHPNLFCLIPTLQEKNCNKSSFVLLQAGAMADNWSYWRLAIIGNHRLEGCGWAKKCSYFTQSPPILSFLNNHQLLSQPRINIG